MHSEKTPPGAKLSKNTLITMNTEFNKVDNVNGVITIFAQSSDFKEGIDKQIKQLIKTKEFPGFRPGKAPRSMVEKKYGQAVKYDVIDRAVTDELYRFIREENLPVLAQPMPDTTDLPNLDAEEMVFKFKVGLAPEINVDVDATLKIPYYAIKVSDEMIDKQSEGLRRRFGSQESGDTVEPNAVVKGVLTELDANGEPKEGGIVVENGIVSPEYFTDEEQKALFVGKNKGAAIIFNPAATCNGNEVELSSMLHIDKEQTAEHHGDFKFDITDIIVLREAQLNQEFFDNVFGKDKVHDEAEYREAVKQMIAAQLVGDSNYRFTIDARDAIMKEAGDIELPDEILKEFLISQSEGVTPENVDAQYAEASKGLKWQLVSDKIAKDLDVKVDHEDIRNMARNVARNQFMKYGMTSVPDDLVDKYADEMLKERKTVERLATEAVQNKLFNAVRAKANVEEREVTVEEFNELFKPADAE